MKLTGKCKEDFEKWLIDNDQYGGVVVFSDRQVLSEEDYVVLLYDMHESMQYGVYVDFFDSVGIKFWITPYYNHDLGVMNEWGSYDEKGLMGVTQKTRQEARQKAIEKANELYNTIKK